MTAIYSWRLIFKTFHGKFNNIQVKFEKLHESPKIMIIPLLVLAIGAIFSGYVFKELFIGINSSNSFWKSSIYYLNPLSTEHPPLWFLLTTPILVILAIPFSYLIFLKNKNLSKQIMENNLPLYEFLKNKWYFDELYNYTIVLPCKKIGYFFWKFIDGLIIDRFGPDGISKVVKKISNKAVQFQSGFIYQYAFIMLLGFSIILTILIIN